jgi:hypothetical protein
MARGRSVEWHSDGFIRALGAAVGANLLIHLGAGAIRPLKKNGQALIFTTHVTGNCAYPVGVMLALVFKAIQVSHDQNTK